MLNRFFSSLLLFSFKSYKLALLYPSCLSFNPTSVSHSFNQLFKPLPTTTTLFLSITLITLFYKKKTTKRTHSVKMRFTAASIAFFAGLAAAIPQGEADTVYSTEDFTITSCAPTVTDCPSRRTSTPQGVEAVTSSTPSVVATSSAVASSSSPVAPVETPSSSSSPVAAAPSSPAPVQQPTSKVVAVEVPTSHVSVIPITTCVPTTTYSTVVVPASSPSSSTVIQGGGALPRPSGALLAVPLRSL